MLLRAPTLFVGLRSERRVRVLAQELVEELNRLAVVPFLSGDHRRFKKSILSRQRIDRSRRGKRTQVALTDVRFDSAARMGRAGSGDPCTQYADLATRAACEGDTSGHARCHAARAIGARRPMH